MKTILYHTMIILGSAVAAYAADNPIDFGDSRQVAAEAFAQLPLADAQDLVPTQIPLIKNENNVTLPANGTLTISHSIAKCPNCSQTSMSWMLSNPDYMTCDSCVTVLPSATYPENATLTMDTWEGVTVGIPYHNDGSGGSYYFKGVIDSFKQMYLFGALNDCAYTYDKTGQSARFAGRMRDIYLHYTETLDQWVCANNNATYIDYDTGSASQSLFPDEWGHRHSFTLPSEFFYFYQTIYDDAELDVAYSPTSTAKEQINEQFFRRFVRYKMSYPEEFGVHNNLGTDIRGMLEYGWHFQWPECMHYAKRWVKNTFDKYTVGYDGMSLEGVGYHYLWLDSALNARGIEDWIDPVGYVDPVDGTNISAPVDFWELFPLGRRLEHIATGPIYISLPNGTPSAVHDGHGGTNRYVHGGWHRIEGPTTESRNRILPSFGHIALGDGRNQKQVQSQLHFSQYGNHASHDSMTFQFYANGRALFEFPAHQNYTRSLVGKNAVVVNHRTSDVYRENIKGMVELYAPTLPGLAVTRVQRDNMVFDHPKRMNRYRRTLLQNTVDLDHPYVVDLFEVEGGALHEYLLAGSMYYEQSASASISLSSLSDPTPFYTSGDDAVWERYTSAKSATISGQTTVDFTYDDQPGQGARVHLAAMNGAELFLSRLATVGEESYGASDDRPHLMIRTSASDPDKNDHQTTFVVVHEAFTGVASISSVEKTDIGNGCMAIRVNLAGRTDTYLVAPDGPQSMAYNGLSANAVIAAFSQSTSDSATDIWMMGGTQASTPARSITAGQSEFSGQLLQVNRTLDGDAFDSFISDIPLPEGRSLAGQLLLVEGYDASMNKTFVNGYTIDEIEIDPGTGQREIRLRHDPGLLLNGGAIEEIYFPFATADTHTVRLINSVSSVPSIVDITPGIPHWKAEAAVTDNGRAFDTSISPAVITLPTNAVVRYTTDGGEPQINSAVFSAGLSFTNTTPLFLKPDNPGGITAPRVARERYYKRKTAVPGTPIAGGLQYFYERYGDQHGTIANLRPETLESFIYRGINLDLSGYIHAPATGLYYFFSRCASDITLKVGDETIIHQIGLGNSTPWEGEIYLEEGWHRIEVDYYSYFTPWFDIQWSGPGFGQQAIPDSALTTGLYPEEVYVPTAGCILWLDATDIDGDGTPEADGSTNLLATWTDKSGLNHHATHTDSSRHPRRKPHGLNGLPVVYFDGVNDYLQFQELDDIRTVFWVLKDEAVDGAGTSRRPLLGHNSTYNFHREYGKIWHGGYVADGVKNGVTWLNGSIIDGTQIDLPEGHHQVALITSETVKANRLSDDRHIADRTWFGDIAEVIIYDRALTETERLQVENHLNQKWFGTGYRNWIAAQPLPASSSDSSDNPDHDSYSNFLEFAFDLNPLVWDAPLSNPLEINSSSNATYKVWNLRTGLDFIVETSTNLLDWTEHTVLPGLTGGSISLFSFAPTNKTFFLRTRITE